MVRRMGCILCKAEIEVLRAVRKPTAARYFTKIPRFVVMGCEGTGESSEPYPITFLTRRPLLLTPAKMALNELH